LLGSVAGLRGVGLPGRHRRVVPDDLRRRHGAGTGPGWPRPPNCWTCRHGPPGAG
jgi:hypothetical protein